MPSWIYIYIYIYIYIHDTQNSQVSQKQNGPNIHVIMKTMCPADYHPNSFMATHALINIYRVPGTVESYRHIYKSTFPGQRMRLFDYSIS